LYGRCQQIFSGPRWEKAARRGANILRPKWSRTTPYTTQFPDTYYVDALIGPHTLTTFSRDTMAAFLDHGQPKVTLTNWTDQVANHMEQLEEMGIDVEGIAQALQDEYLQASAHRFHSITKKISQKREEMEQHRSVASVH
jgi:transaldolase